MIGLGSALRRGQDVLTRHRDFTTKQLSYRRDRDEIPRPKDSVVRAKSVTRLGIGNFSPGQAVTPEPYSFVPQSHRPALVSPAGNFRQSLSYEGAQGPKGRADE